MSTTSINRKKFEVYIFSYFVKSVVVVVGNNCSTVSLIPAIDLKVHKREKFLGSDIEICTFQGCESRRQTFSSISRPRFREI